MIGSKLDSSTTHCSDMTRHSARATWQAAVRHGITGGSNTGGNTTPGSDHTTCRSVPWHDMRQRGHGGATSGSAIAATRDAAA